MAIRRFCCLSLNFGDLEAEVDVCYWFTPADPGVRYYPDGSGCPPTRPEIEVDRIKVFSITTRSGTVLTDKWLKERGLYVIALDIVEDRFNTAFVQESSIWYDLLEDATSE